jgi:3-oxoacyl-[acyl-carrier protein] reductase
MWAAGADLLLVARTAPDLRSLQAEFQAQPVRPDQRIHIFAADLCDPAAVPAILDAAYRVWGHIDVLVNNAATAGPIGPVWEADWGEWVNTLQVNLLAPVALCRASVPGMLAHGGGKIINLSGGGATSPRPRFSAYATAKAGLIRFSETLAHEVKDGNIAVNCIAPGIMNTAMLQAIVTAGVAEAGEAEYQQAVSRGEGDTVAMERAAGLCVFLASPGSDGISGRLISAVWDPWMELAKQRDTLQNSDIYTLRRIVPKDRGMDWG